MAGEDFFPMPKRKLRGKKPIKSSERSISTHTFSCYEQVYDFVDLSLVHYMGKVINFVKFMRQIVMEWIQHVVHQNCFSSENMKIVSATVLTYGSYGLVGVIFLF